MDGEHDERQRQDDERSATEMVAKEGVLDHRGGCSSRRSLIESRGQRNVNDHIAPAARVQPAGFLPINGADGPVIDGPWPRRPDALRNAMVGRTARDESRE